MKPYNAIALAYFGLGVLWIVITDRAVAAFADESLSVAQLQTVKGWIFVFLSSLLIWILTRRAFQLQQRAEAEKRAIFRKTLEGTHHILLNYLNQMQLVTMEARKADDFDHAVLETAQRVSLETVQELRDLENLPFDGADDIDSFIYRRLRETRQAVELRVAADGER